MRILVICPSGESRLIQVDDSALVKDLKHELQDLEGIPVGQQHLCYAGLPMKDHLSLADHHLSAYTLSDEVVIYLSERRAHPKTIFLLSRSNPSLKFSELVEHDMAVGDVMALLTSRGIAAPFVEGASIYVKRQDGSTLPMSVESSQSIASLETKVKQLEGVKVANLGLSFAQAQDGCMHVFIWPSTESAVSSETFPIYSRGTLPQPSVIRKDQATAAGVPFNQLVKELCVLP